MVGGENGDQHIGVMDDFIQIKVILVIVVGCLVVIQVVLQLCLHLRVGGLGPQHILIAGGIGGTGNAGTHAFKHHGTGGHGVEQETEHHHQGDAHQKAPPVPPDELCRLFTLFGGGFGGLCRLFRSFGGTACGLARTLGSGILFFDGVLLLPSGQRIAGKLGIIPQAFVVKGVNVGLFQPFLGFGGLPVRFQLVGMVGALNHAPARFGGFFHLVGALHAHIIFLGLPDFLVYFGENRVPRRIPYCMGQLGRRLFLIHFLKAQAGDGLAGGRVRYRFLEADFLLRDFRPRFFCLVRRPVCLADGLFQCRGSPFLFGKL